MKPSKQAVDFFHANAGYSWNPKTETQAQGRRRCAKALALAELQASNAGVSFEWSIDDVDSSDFTDEKPAWALWFCVARLPDGERIGSCGGVDFGRDGEPWGNNYRRVCEAEIVSDVDFDALD